MVPALPLFPDLILQSAAPALRVAERTLSYAQLAAAERAFHARVLALGIAPGQRILVWAHPDLESLVGLVAAVTSGVVLVPVNPGVGEQELQHIVNDAAPACVFSSQVERDAARVSTHTTHALFCERAEARASTFCERAEARASTFCERAEARASTFCERAEARASTPALDAVSEPPPRSPGDPEQPCLVLYTSGTTGAPKGALLCARNIAATLDGLQDAWQLSAQDTIVHALPLFHAHGLVFGLYGALRVGACLEFVPKFSPEAVARALLGPARVLYAVPTMYHRIAEAAQEDNDLCAALANARLLVSGSAALPAREHARIEALSGQRVCERYGLSETLINTAVRADGERRAGYVGIPLANVEIKLVDDARNPIASAGQDSFGEVAVRGPNVFLGYLNKPDATAAVRDGDGFFYTGDLGALAPDGYLRIVGRKATDIIKSGGFKIGAGEVEGALLEHEAVREVAVVGAPDADLGERIVAFVVAQDPKPPPEALIELVTRALGKHKRPREIRYVDALPRNAMGKVQKAKLR